MNFELGNLIHTTDRTTAKGENVGDYCVVVWSFNKKFLPAKIVAGNQIRYLFLTDESGVKHTRIEFNTKAECVNFLNSVILMEL